MNNQDLHRALERVCLLHGFINVQAALSQLGQAIMADEHTGYAKSESAVTTTTVTPMPKRREPAKPQQPTQEVKRGRGRPPKSAAAQVEPAAAKAEKAEPKVKATGGKRVLSEAARQKIREAQYRRWQTKNTANGEAADKPAKVTRKRKKAQAETDAQPSLPIEQETAQQVLAVVNGVDHSAVAQVEAAFDAVNETSTAEEGFHLHIPDDVQAPPQDDELAQAFDRLGATE